jgi:surface antigen
VLAALPLLVLLGGLRGGAPTPGTEQVDVALQGLAARLVTDGHPRAVALPVRRVAVPARVPARPGHTTAGRSRPGPAPAATVPTAVPQVAAPRDGYPYRDATGSDVDPWGFTKRQCVSYAAWRLAEAGRRIDNRDGWGSALDWDASARRHGFAVTSHPSVGAIAHWDAHESGAFFGGGSTVANGRFTAGALGHVAWVTRVYADGSVLVAQYNGTGDRTFSTMRVEAPRYLLL